MQIAEKARKRAIDFWENETQFHLGMLPTEQSNPKTAGLDEVFIKSVEDGVKMLLSVDQDIIPMAQNIFAGKEFEFMLEESYRAVTNGGKIIFSGCGATGRLSILLESMWRTFFRQLDDSKPEIYAKVAEYENTVFSIMTGGDYALIKSVESFEDYPQFGRRQAQEFNICDQDVLVGITEGGETFSVLGSVKEALDVNAKAFIMFNNPADILCEHIERSMEIIENPAVTVLDLYCGSMAVAGSTRMQATTSEQLIAGAMLEKLLARLLRENLTGRELSLFPEPDIDFVAEMNSLVNSLQTPEAAEALGHFIRIEENVYRNNALVTYFADEFLIDIFTDTTERAPTFMLPSFRKFDDLELLPSWAFVKDPYYNTPDAWKHCLGRDLRCLEWSTEDYIQMDTPEKIISNPPAVSKKDMLRFLIGNEEEKCRFESLESTAFNIFSGPEYLNKQISGNTPVIENFSSVIHVIVGDCPACPENAIHIPVGIPASNLKLMEHMAVKLTMNTISTGTMVLMGKVTGNWMSFVSLSDKKLVDRSIRLISELGRISYKEACYALFQSLHELEQIDFKGKEEPSPVQDTLQKLLQNK